MDRQKKYYDPAGKQLIYVNRNADPGFWDELWSIDEGLQGKLRRTERSFVSKITRRFLRPEDGAVLEGGCGTGIHVAALTHSGYRAVGIDYAEATVQALNRLAPELDIRRGDVRNLPFGKGEFRGYWSLGVIEHFWDGYADIAEQMHSVLETDGLLFLTFPHMSPLRRLKARLGMYPRFAGGMPEGFYQFALDSRTVEESFERLGFQLVKRMPFAGIKGTKDELGWLRPVLQRLYDHEGGALAVRAFKAMLDTTLAPMAGHSVLLVFRKT